MVHRRPVYIYFLNVPSFSSRYFNKIKQTSRLGRLLALSQEILNAYNLRTAGYQDLSHDVASGSDITPCNKIDKQLFLHKIRYAKLFEAIVK